jgi:excisionase family DNA binding protein
VDFCADKGKVRTVDGPGAAPTELLGINDRRQIVGITGRRYHNDMDSEGRLLTSGEVARRLGTSVPRVLRAAKRGEVGAVRRGNRFLFDAEAVERLRRRWGAVPSLPGLSREDVLVLAALGRRPLGLRSGRAVARAAGVSPTAAGRALRRLAERGYVTRETARVTEGEVRDVPVWTVRWTGPAWLEAAAAVGQATLPVEGAPRRPRLAPSRRQIPSRLAHLLWNEDLAALDVEKDAVLLADRILRSEDPEAHVWMVEHLPASAIIRATRTRNLDRRRASLGRLLAAAAR